MKRSKITSGRGRVTLQDQYTRFRGEIKLNQTPPKYFLREKWFKKNGEKNKQNIACASSNKANFTKTTILINMYW